jgi:hypothetical protein
MAVRNLNHLTGHDLSLSTRHAKLRREGYRKPERQ